MERSKKIQALMVDIISTAQPKDQQYVEGKLDELEKEIKSHNEVRLLKNNFNKGKNKIGYRYGEEE